MFADGGAVAGANVTPVIQAYIGNNVQVKNVTGNIVIQAESVRAEGDASAQVDGGGARLQRCRKLDRQQQSDGQCLYRHRLQRQCRGQRHDLGQLRGRSRAARPGQHVQPRDRRERDRTTPSPSRATAWSPATS